MMAQVLTYIGQTINPSDLYSQLLAIQPAGTLYPAQRALGSIGGSIARGFIGRNCNGDYVRLR